MQKIKNSFDRNYIAPLTLKGQMYILFLISNIISVIPRIYYNGFITTFTTNLFEISWFGMAWGNTPIIIRFFTLIFLLIITATCSYYIKKVKMKIYPRIYEYNLVDLLLDTYKKIKILIKTFKNK